MIKPDYPSTLALNLNELNEQYSSMLTLTDTIIHISQEKLYKELSWESLQLRLSCRKPVALYKIFKTKEFDLLFSSIP